MSSDLPAGDLAHSESLLGLLQRGRGDGWRHALDDPMSASELVLECVIEDPRWDRQVEGRSYYYAAIIDACDAPTAPLRPDDADFAEPELIIETLGELARRGRGDAVEVLTLYLESPSYEEALYQLHVLGELNGREAPLWNRLSDEDIADLAHIYTDFPWRQWRERYPRVASVLEQQPERTRTESSSSKLPPVDRDLEVLLEHPWARPYLRRLIHRLTHLLRAGEQDRLVALVGQGTTHQRLLSLEILTRLGDDRAVDSAVELVRGDEPAPLLGAARRYLSSLQSEVVLELALSWIDADDGRYRAATAILSERSRPSDEELITDALSAAWRRRDYYAICDLIDALARHPQAGDLDVVKTVWREAEYSYCRRRIARGFKGFHAVREAVAAEGLWDCEDEVRLLFIDHVDATSESVRRRLAELAADSCEDAKVMAAAAAAAR